MGGDISIHMRIDINSKGIDGTVSSRLNGKGTARNRTTALRSLHTSHDGDGKGLSSSTTIPIINSDVDTKRTDERSEPSLDHFFFLLDSNDVMQPHRIAKQTSVMLHLPIQTRPSTLLG